MLVIFCSMICTCLLSLPQGFDLLSLLPIYMSPYINPPEVEHSCLAPENIYHPQKERFVFQASFFRGELLHFGDVIALETSQ